MTRYSSKKLSTHLIQLVNKKYSLDMAQTEDKNVYEIFKDAVRELYPEIPANAEEISYSTAVNILNKKLSKGWINKNKKYFRLSPNNKLYKFEIEELATTLFLFDKFIEKGIIEKKKDIRGAEYYAIVSSSDNMKKKGKQHQQIIAMLEAVQSPVIQKMSELYSE